MRRKSCNCCSNITVSRAAQNPILWRKTATKKRVGLLGGALLQYILTDLLIYSFVLIPWGSPVVVGAQDDVNLDGGRPMESGLGGALDGISTVNGSATVPATAAAKPAERAERPSPSGRYAGTYPYRDRPYLSAAHDPRSPRHRAQEQVTQLPFIVVHLGS